MTALVNPRLIVDDVSEALERWRRSGFSLDGISHAMVTRMKARLDDEIAWSRAEQRQTVMGFPIVEHDPCDSPTCALCNGSATIVFGNPDTAGR